VVWRGASEYRLLAFIQNPVPTKDKLITTATIHLNGASDTGNVEASSSSFITFHTLLVSQLTFIIHIF
jgi:hypothetical protein